MKAIGFNDGWRFCHEGKSDWISVKLPHDAMLHDGRDPKSPGKDACGYFVGGVYVYEKNFMAPTDAGEKHLELSFGGIYRNSSTFVNGILAGGRPYGYSPFSVSLDGLLKAGEKNTIRVVADNSQQPNSRWYSGGGIYRGVQLLTSGREYIKQHGLKITTVSIKPPVIRVDVDAAWYGSKVWHSNVKYRRVIWQCNAKFKDKSRCKTPHLTEDEIKAAFVRMVNKLYIDREFYITELTAIKDRLGDTTALEKERRILDEQLGIDAKAVNDLIARNARVAQNQKEYNERYDALVSRYEETEHKRDAITEQINQIMIRRRKIERFIESVKDLPELITEFDESLWAGLVDSMTVHSKDRIVFRLTCGMEMEL